MGQYSADVVETADLHLDFEILPILAAIVDSACNSFLDTACEVDMVVLDQNHVEQADAVVGPSSDFHCLLFEHTHAGSGLTGVEHPGLESLELILIAACHGGYSAHALHYIEHGALGDEKGTDGPFGSEGHITLLHFRPIADHHLHLYRGIDFMEHFFSDIDSGENAVFLDDEAGTAHGVGRDCRKGGMVAVAEIFGESEIE